MGLSDAILSQAMATKHRRSKGVIQANIGKINALLKIALDKNKINWSGFGDTFDWHIYKVDTDSNRGSWVSGQLGTRTFEEKDPVAEATLPYCFIEKTYGIGEKSIKTNRAGGNDKVFDIQKLNAEIAQRGIYKDIAISMYYGGTDTLVPVGIVGATCKSYSSATAHNIPSGASYAGITQTSGAITTYTPAKGSTSWSAKYWAPEIFDMGLSPSASATSAKWSAEGIYALSDMETAMSATADITGTGKIIKPDLALMDKIRFQQLKKLCTTSQLTYNIPVGNQALVLAGFSTIRVGGLDVVMDDNVPDDNDYNGSASGYAQVFVVDSSAFSIETLNTKGEGLVEAQWKQDDPEIIGGVGVYKANMAYKWDTPAAIGVILGCND